MVEVTPDEERQLRDGFRQAMRAADEVIMREVESREFPHLVRTVRFAALGANGRIGEWHDETTLLDSATTGVIVPRRMVQELGTHRIRGPWPASVLLCVEMDGCPTFPVLASVSDARAAVAHPDAQVIIGDEIALDWMRRLWRPLEPLTDKRKRLILRQQGNKGWHEHVFSPYCRDEVHGRFDARRGEWGFEVLDAGAWAVVASARNGVEAVEIAQALAAEWRPPRAPRTPAPNKKGDPHEPAADPRTSQDQQEGPQGPRRPARPARGLCLSARDE